MSIRKLFQKREDSFISPYGCKSNHTRGRKIEEESCPIRTPFQKDRDRIVYCNAFRRLKHKTQVFLSPLGDHYRTRLTHTLEVSEIARTIARALSINEDLTEAIALGHDLGHTPFGHGGETALKEIFSPRFVHNVQSIRVVNVLENFGKGLNLTYEVKDGIFKHSKGGFGKIIPTERKDSAVTIEGQVVRIADIMAYLNHDLDDAIRSQVIKPNQIPDECIRVFGNSHSQRVTTMIKDLVFSSEKVGDKLKLIISKDCLSAMQLLRQFLYENVYRSQRVHNEFIKAKAIISKLFFHLLEYPDIYQKAAKDLEMAKCSSDCRPNERQVADVIASMTDRYALNLYQSLFFPSSIV
ncbi:Deoxyguanosinetriphosphate triphosphohydrolase [Candidatus Magnetomorum sp. HK-1]|nr:Deoxyguanosinetriphosphate triphosphohydrolase [Candidatus Magnetomorum sp. HK-1]